MAMIRILLNDDMVFCIQFDSSKILAPVHVRIDSRTDMKIIIFVNLYHGLPVSNIFQIIIASSEVENTDPG